MVIDTLPSRSSHGRLHRKLRKFPRDQKVDLLLQRSPGLGGGNGPSMDRCERTKCA